MSPYVKTLITHYLTGKWAEPTIMQQRIFITVVTSFVLIGLYCIFAEAPFEWLFGNIIIHDLEL
jgi:hypothetical protein